LASTLIAAEVDPACEPLGPFNKLVIAPGILAGTMAPCCQRMSVGGKSPLTGGIKEANSGGIFGVKMGRLGLAAVVLEGRKPGACTVVYINKDGAELVEMPELKDQGNYEVSRALREKYGDHIGIASIGPVGERLSPSATVAFIDQDGVPARHAARGGLGAVMGAKGVKAVVCDDAGAPKLVRAKDQAAFKEAAKGFTKVVRERPRVKKRLPVYGTPGLVAFASEVNSFPTRNFSTGTFERVDKICGDAVVKLIDERGGQRGHSCYKGCIIGCSNVFNDTEGRHKTSSLEYETLCLLGSNLDIDDVDAIAEMDRMCDDFGIDTIELGGAMGVAMDAGVLRFGDVDGAVDTVKQVGQGTVLGRLLAGGPTICGKVLGVYRVAAIKNQGLPAWDPRTAWATGTTFVTTPMGADHTAGRLQGILEFDKLEPGFSGQLSSGMQVRVCAQDSVGLCQFSDGTPDSVIWMTKLLEAFHGEALEENYFENMGRRVFKTEQKFNERAGLGKHTDRLPEFMTIEPLPPTNSLFGVAQEEIDQYFDDLKND
jgi:aldehyde:ferredoxin oxidoreductase